MSHTLILGGGLDQTPLIREAIAFGLKTIVVDANDECPGRELSDLYIHESNRNVNAILRAIKKLGVQNEITSVLVIGSDIPHIACEICNQLGLNYWMSDHAASVATNKLKMKIFLIENNISTASHQVVSSYDSIMQILSRSNSKKIIKPQEAAGSRGVFLIDSQALLDEEIFKIYHDCLKFCDDKPPILEDYIEGQQLSIEALILNSVPQIYGYALRNYEMNSTFAPQIIENGGLQPYPNAFDKVEEIKIVIKNICLGLGIVKGVIKLDLVIDAITESVYVIEFALRLSGGNFSSDIIPKSLNVNLLQDYLSMVYDKEVQIFNFQNYEKLYANRYLFREGIIGTDVSIDHNYVEHTEILNKPGGYIDRIRTHGDRAAWFLVSGDNVAEVEGKIDAVYKKYNRYKKY
tara:strand:+ start:2935 stop:4152 length:1218 start_codon:yes stop_codon:yes gene_type:complete